MKDAHIRNKIIKYKGENKYMNKIHKILISIFAILILSTVTIAAIPTNTLPSNYNSVAIKRSSNLDTMTVISNSIPTYGTAKEICPVDVSKLNGWRPGGTTSARCGSYDTFAVVFDSSSVSSVYHNKYVKINWYYSDTRKQFTTYAYRVYFQNKVYGKPEGKYDIMRCLFRSGCGLDSNDMDDLLMVTNAISYKN